MENSLTQTKNQKVVKILSWILIVISAFYLIQTFSGFMMLIQANITKNFTKPVEINYSQFLITYSIALLIYVLILVSAVYVLKHKELWRKVLIYSLIFLILSLLISPIINYNYSPTVKLQVENVNDYGMVDTLNKINLL